jgi:RNA recognition motif-containing protein
MAMRSSLFIGDLDISTNETQISEVCLIVLCGLIFFLKYFNKLLQKDAIQSVKVVREHTAPYNSRKYGYINFNSHTDAETTLTNFNYQQINGKQYRLSWCEPDPSSRKTQKGNVCVKVWSCYLI